MKKLLTLLLTALMALTAVFSLTACSEDTNEGIVDVSYKYEKMYVIRPQFFIPLITILRNAAKNSLSYRRELAEIRSQNVEGVDLKKKKLKKKQNHLPLKKEEAVLKKKKLKKL